MATKNTTDKSGNTTSAKIKKVTDDERIDVKSCRMGKLIWKSRKTGYKLIWDEFGVTNPMTVEELREMRNGDRIFFEENWVTLEGDRAQAIMDNLGISKFYTEIEGIDDVDEILAYEPDEIIAVVSKLRPSVKELVARRAASLKEEGKLDSVKVINAVEEATGFSIEV